MSEEPARAERDALWEEVQRQLRACAACQKDASTTGNIALFAFISCAALHLSDTRLLAVLTAVVLAGGIRYRLRNRGGAAAHRRRLAQAIERAARGGEVRCIRPLLLSGTGLIPAMDRQLVDELLTALLPRVRPGSPRMEGPEWAARISSRLPIGETAPSDIADRSAFVLAALSALKHIGGRGDLYRIEALAVPSQTADWGIPIRRAATEAAAAIEARLAQEAARSTLLRPAEPGAETLLRPDEDGEANLLRASEDQGREART